MKRTMRGNFFIEITHILKEFEEEKKRGDKPLAEVEKETAQKILALFQREKIPYEKIPFYIIEILNMYSIATDFMLQEVLSDIVQHLSPEQFEKLSPSTKKIIKAFLNDNDYSLQ